jgi:hypothetical protein
MARRKAPAPAPEAEEIKPSSPAKPVKELPHDDFDANSPPPRRCVNPPPRFSKHNERTDPDKLVSEWKLENRVPKDTLVRRWTPQTAHPKPICIVQIGESWSQGLWEVYSSISPDIL